MLRSLDLFSCTGEIGDNLKEHLVAVLECEDGAYRGIHRFGTRAGFLLRYRRQAGMSIAPALVPEIRVPRLLSGIPT